MVFLLAALAVWFIGGILALAFSRRERLVSFLGPATVVIGCVLAAMEAAKFLGGGIATFHGPWPVPLGSFRLGLDPLSAIFVVPIALVCSLAAIYGGSYLRHDSGQKNLGAAWCFYLLLTASMVLVVTARNAMLFLFAWEAMTLASFFLVMFDDEQEQVQRAGWTYLVASHLGAAFLFAMFVLLGRKGSFDFNQFAATPGNADLLFLLAIVGFGTKAGLVPLHVWLPEAHPAAPSHVSAVMSGVMIKMGIYGLLRTLTILGPPPAWWGWLLVVAGASSGILGVLFALAQHDLKRLLAYHSVENIGIIALGLGVGLLGVSYRQAAMATLGFAGGILHVLNHALFKSLLFLGAGAVAHVAGTRDIDRLGGLLKSMPVTGATFLVGAAAISGLPPLNGFVSELLVYVGAFGGLTGDAATLPVAVGSLVVIGSLALIGGLAAACFTKAFGAVFLGEARTEPAHKPHDPDVFQRGPLVVLAAACVLIGAAAPLAPQFLAPTVATLLKNAPPAAAAEALAVGQTALTAVCCGSAALVVIVGLLVWLRWRLLAGREVGKAGTWDCGYAAPSARMQYTASSFAQPLVNVFRVFLGTKTRVHFPNVLFPDHADFHSDTPDLFRDRLFAPLFAAFRWAAYRLRGLQQGRIQLYVLYIAIALVVLLIWKLG